MSLVLSGDYYWNDGTIWDQSARGYWYSSIPNPNKDMATSVVDLLLNTLNPQGEGYKPGGYALRCVRPKTYPAGSSAARSYPVSLVLGGYYLWNSGQLVYQDIEFGLWTSLAYSYGPNLSRNLGVSSVNLLPANAYPKTTGFALRWL